MAAFDFGLIPKGVNSIQSRRQINDFLKDCRLEAKPEKCLICGKKTTRFCNSHSIPKMILKIIAKEGIVLQANELMGLATVDVEKGINSAGTFQFICNDCDSRLFQHYENPECLGQEVLSDCLLAEIALKDVLQVLCKRSVEQELFKKASKDSRISGTEVMLEAQSLDVRDFMEEMRLLQSITVNDFGMFKLMCHMVLPYTVPIAVQSGMVITKDLEGNVINDIYDFSPEIRIQTAHIAVFPFADKTIVLMFYHRRDKNYRGLMHQFNCLSDDDKLCYINYLVFKYTENYYFSPLVKGVLSTNKRLVDLARENDESPNLGFANDLQRLQYKPVEMKEIPNLLSKEFAICMS